MNHPVISGDNYPHLHRQQKRRVGGIHLVALLAALPLMATADTPLTVKVTVTAPPPCIINDDRPIEVAFGEVMTTRVDGGNYTMPVDYTLSCTDASDKTVLLWVAGTGAAFDSTVLKTNVPGLGIKLLQDEKPLPIYMAVKFTYPNKPALYAVPVKQSGVTLTTGEFSAAATLSVMYQ
jgi:type 1 fimbria pilin